MAASDDNSDKECPLCMEPFELDDFTFFPCICEYQICRFCWHRIRTDENGLCPACRQPYPENPVNFKALTQEELKKISLEKKQKEQQKKQKVSESRKHLSNLRVVQKNLVFVVGIAPRLSDPEVLKRGEYFGKFGRIQKVMVNNQSTYIGTQGPSASAYVTYSKSEDALRAIQAVNNLQVDGRTMKACLGTTKYCSMFLKNQPCSKTDCMYLHEIGDPTASFTKEDMQQGKHTEYERKLIDQVFSILAASTGRRPGTVSPCNGWPVEICVDNGETEHFGNESFGKQASIINSNLTVNSESANKTIKTVRHARHKRQKSRSPICDASQQQQSNRHSAIVSGGGGGLTNIPPRLQHLHQHTTGHHQMSGHGSLGTSNSHSRTILNNNNYHQKNIPHSYLSSSNDNSSATIPDEDNGAVDSNKIIFSQSNVSAGPVSDIISSCLKPTSLDVSDVVQIYSPSRDDSPLIPVTPSGSFEKLGDVFSSGNHSYQANLRSLDTDVSAQPASNVQNESDDNAAINMCNSLLNSVDDTKMDHVVNTNSLFTDYDLLAHQSLLNLRSKAPTESSFMQRFANLSYSQSSTIKLDPSSVYLNAQEVASSSCNLEQSQHINTNSDIFSFGLAPQAAQLTDKSSVPSALHIHAESVSCFQNLNRRGSLGGDDDLGFDPFAESSKGLEDMLRMEEQQRSWQSTGSFMEQNLNDSRLSANRDSVNRLNSSQNNRDQDMIRNSGHMFRPQDPSKTVPDINNTTMMNSPHTGLSQFPLDFTPPESAAESMSDYFNHSQNQNHMNDNNKLHASNGWPPNRINGTISPHAAPFVPGRSQHRSQPSPPLIANDKFLTFKDWQDGLRQLFPNVNIQFAPNLNPPPSTQTGTKVSSPSGSMPGAPPFPGHPNMAKWPGGPMPPAPPDPTQIMGRPPPPLPHVFRGRHNMFNNQHQSQSILPVGQQQHNGHLFGPPPPPPPGMPNGFPMWNTKPQQQLPSPDGLVRSASDRTRLGPVPNHLTSLPPIYTDMPGWPANAVAPPPGFSPH